MRKQVEVQCNSCKQMHLKDASEVKRNAKIGRANYCSRTCVGKSEANIAHLNSVPKTTTHLDPANQRDEFTIFRDHLRRAKRRNKECNLELQDLKSVWDQQQGKCVYSKVQLIPTVLHAVCDPIYTLSLDRTDSSKGYIKGNIQFISVTMNHMKNSMTHEKMLEALQVLKH